MDILAIIINIILKRKTDKQYNNTLGPKMEYKYWRNIKFENVTPVEAGIISGKDTVGENTLVTILFELEKKNIVNMELLNGEYFISLKCKNMQIINDLEEYEKNIIKLIFDGIEDETKKSLSQIINYFKNDKELKVYIKEVYKKIRKHILKKYYKPYVLYGEDKIKIFKIVALFFLVPFAVMSLISVSSSSTIVWGILKISGSSAGQFNNLMKILGYIIIGVMYLIPIFELLLFIKLLKTYYIKNEYIDEAAKLRGLYNYINEFSLIKEKEIKYYELYDEYYLYAVSMGIADKFKNICK